MKTKCKTVRIAGKMPIGDPANDEINIRTANGSLMTNKLKCLLGKYHNRLIVDNSLVYELTVNYRKKSHRVKSLEAENKRLKAELKKLQEQFSNSCC